MESDVETERKLVPIEDLLESPHKAPVEHHFIRPESGGLFSFCGRRLDPKTERKWAGEAMCPECFALRRDYFAALGVHLR